VIGTKLIKTVHMLHVHMRYILLHESYKLGRNQEWAVLEDAEI
jgi:hypothetical protein